MGFTNQDLKLRFIKSLNDGILTVIFKFTSSTELHSGTELEIQKL